jgi:hypothetical protein
MISTSHALDVLDELFFPVEKAVRNVPSGSKTVDEFETPLVQVPDVPDHVSSI